MATATAPAAGIPAAPEPRRRSVLYGAAFASAASLMYFAGLFGVYLSTRAATLADGRTWLPDSVRVELAPPTVMAWTLLLSIVTMQWAVHAEARDDRPHAYLAFAVTFIFGLSTIVQTGFQFTQLEMVIDGSVAEVLIYTIVGSWLVMMVGALVFLTLTALRTMAGQLAGKHEDDVAAVAMYWYAVVFVYQIIWIAIFIFK